jgi:beta-glucosidase
VKELKGLVRYSEKRRKQAGRINFGGGFRFYSNLAYIYEPGDFKVFVGGNSRDVKEASFTLAK